MEKQPTWQEQQEQATSRRQREDQQRFTETERAKRDDAAKDREQIRRTGREGY